jgi:hypothetical protein
MRTGRDPGVLVCRRVGFANACPTQWLLGTSAPTVWKELFTSERNLAVSDQV